MLIDIDISNTNAIDNQSGIGGIIGIGAKYNFEFGASIFVNPYYKTHSVVPFSNDEGNHQRLTESAIRFGLTFQL